MQARPDKARADGLEALETRDSRGCKRNHRAAYLLRLRAT